MCYNNSIGYYNYSINIAINALQFLFSNTIMLNNKSILITGGTGSFGNAFIPMTLEKYNPKLIIIFSRDEMKQWEMAQKFKDETRVKFVIGDVRDKEHLSKTLIGIDYVVHAAATKIVPTAEYNPFECVKTNINGATNLIDACIDRKIKAVVALSTDKASNPINLYGATKLASDKLFVAANSYGTENNTKFAVVRYGNVMGSRGSVIPFFLKQRNSKKLPITDTRMTRFMISLEDAVKLVWHSFGDMHGGEIYVKKIPSMLITDIAKAINDKAKINIIGIRPGEKIHEQMIGIEDAPHTYEYENHYKILPAIYGWSTDPLRIKNGKKVAEDFSYSSDINSEWMSVDELREWISENESKIGQI